MPMIWHPTRVWDQYTSEDEKKDINVRLMKSSITVVQKLYKKGGIKTFLTHKILLKNLWHLHALLFFNNKKTMKNVKTKYFNNYCLKLYKNGDIIEIHTIF